MRCALSPQTFIGAPRWLGYGAPNALGGYGNIVQPGSRCFIQRVEHLEAEKRLVDLRNVPKSVREVMVW